VILVPLEKLGLKEIQVPRALLEYKELLQILELQALQVLQEILEIQALQEPLV
jgi:hypothetical protein